MDSHRARSRGISSSPEDLKRGLLPCSPEEAFFSHPKRRRQRVPPAPPEGAAPPLRRHYSSAARQNGIDRLHLSPRGGQLGLGTRGGAVQKRWPGASSHRSPMAVTQMQTD